jgi:hypothetical protein
LSFADSFSTLSKKSLPRHVLIVEPSMSIIYSILLTWQNIHILKVNLWLLDYRIL